MTDQTRSHPMCWRGDHSCSAPTSPLRSGSRRWAMTDDLILADAIYAAGQALHVDACTEGDPHDGCDCGDWDREAEIAVRAALPSIEHQLRELIAQAIEALPNLSVNHFGTRPLPDLIRKDTAARIARGDASND